MPASDVEKADTESSSHSERQWRLTIIFSTNETRIVMYLFEYMSRFIPAFSVKLVSTSIQPVDGGNRLFRFASEPTLPPEA